MTSKRREGNRIPELDGLRVLMIFIVSWFHIWQQSWLEPVIRIPALGIWYSLDWLVRSGYVWVDGTVLLSAFLIYLPFERARREGRPIPDTREFYFRRAKRIVPGYWFIILLTLFVVVIPWDPYRSAPFMVKDLFTHFTFIFNLFKDTYLQSPLGGAPWTLAVIAQGYLLFPLFARGIRRRPAVTLVAMALAAFAFRAWCLWGLSEYSFVVNQLVNFLDIYALGILCAVAFPRLREWTESEAVAGRKSTRIIVQAAATVLFFACLYGLAKMLKVQAGSQGYPTLQGNQMLFRPVFGACFAGMILSAPFMVKPLRLLLGNPVTKFLSMISMNYYLIHQTIAVHLKRLHIPPSVSEQPNVDRELSWMMPYSWLCFGISVALAALITFLIEKPGGRLMEKWRKRKDKKPAI